MRNRGTAQVRRHVDDAAGAAAERAAARAGRDEAYVRARSPPRQLDRARLLPMYEALHARTRAADNETVIFYALLAQAGRAGAGEREL